MQTTQKTSWCPTQAALTLTLSQRERRRSLAFQETFLLVTVAVLAGCRSFSLPKPPIEDVAVERREREAAVIEEFEQKRNFAEFEASKAAWSRGDLRNSQAGLERLLRRAPRQRDARLLLARVYFEQGQSPEALAQLQTALADFPNDPEVHRAMGSLLENLHQTEDAWAHFDRAAKLAAQQGSSPAAGPRGATGVSTVLPHEQAARGPQPNQVGSVVPASGFEAGDAAKAEKSSGQRPASAAPSVGVDDNGGNGGAGGASISGLLRAGEQALAAGGSEQALAQFRQAAAIEPNNPHIPTAAAIAALHQSCPEVAVAVAQEALVAFPGWTPLLRTLGTAYYRQGDYESSELVLRQALSLDKSDALAYFLLGCTHLKLDQVEAAGECFAEARRIDPSLAVR
jgi:tetratricopeptide (TPR) repeat protein